MVSEPDVNDKQLLRGSQNENNDEEQGLTDVVNRLTSSLE
ncbi:hypothetical protein L917_17628 [Phytophthora nicotianae]|uniref:Uncharacterized protein n=3 Tax=Phytophthora nicotianae TaxID=4792 RepID=W2PL22_PHYN3|nr:hypothetical protein PPTG_24032 [Phytophthora nicotianae INRA-310]ETL82150.1 hypothetical protein L917_17628 [Phytophthora nicotianae]ETN01562.1 hypothetical protein PPTG_24032 [Phytophthora nicotianae INRA-310]ETO63964.1 hypothetical protein F444_18410 [Phytophthora nicotianae P1976]